MSTIWAQQITDYLATSPKISRQTLFVLWGGAIDLLHATSSNDVVRAAINQALNVQRLINAGATQFIIPNLPPLGLVPRLNGSPVDVSSRHSGKHPLQSSVGRGPCHRQAGQSKSAPPNHPTRRLLPLQTSHLVTIQILAAERDWKFARQSPR